jgi:hypothetical protein
MSLTFLIGWTEIMRPLAGRFVFFILAPLEIPSNDNFILYTWD